MDALNVIWYDLPLMTNYRPPIMTKLPLTINDLPLMMYIPPLIRFLTYNNSIGKTKGYIAHYRFNGILFYENEVHGKCSQQSFVGVRQIVNCSP